MSSNKPAHPLVAPSGAATNLERAGHLDCRECEKAAAEDRTIYAAKRTAEAMKGRTFQRNLYDWLADYHQRRHVDDD